MSVHTKFMLFSLVFLQLLTCICGYRIVCYYTNWAQYRVGKGKFLPENITEDLCTHIIYAYAKPIGLGMQSVEWNDEAYENNIGMYARVQKLKEKYPNLLVLLALGDDTVGSNAYIPIVGQPAARLAFAQNVITYLRRNGFDGLDVNWNYPGSRGRPVVGSLKYAQLLQELSDIFDVDSVMRGQPRLLLSATLPQIKETIDRGYDVVSIAKIVDFVSLMTFDFHGSWESRVGLNAPLFGYPGMTGYQQYLSLDWVARYYLMLGVPKEKINIGISLYGRSFTLDDPSVYVVGSPAMRPGTAGRYTTTKGMLSYYEICDLRALGGTTVEVQPQHGRFLIIGDQWVGFDDVQSVSEKACYTKENEFGGVMIRSLDLDDFSGESCGEGTFPLIKAIVKIFQADGLSRCEAFGSFLYTSSSRAYSPSPEYKLMELAPVFVWYIINYY